MTLKIVTSNSREALVSKQGTVVSSPEYENIGRFSIICKTEFCYMLNFEQKSLIVSQR